MPKKLSLKTGRFAIKNDFFFKGACVKKTRHFGRRFFQLKTRAKSPPLEGRVVVTWAARRSRKIFFFGFLLSPDEIRKKGALGGAFPVVSFSSPLLLY